MIRRLPARLATLLPAVLLALAAAAPAAAQAVLAGPWTKAALYGGDVRSLAPAPDDPEIVYAGTTHGHVYVSRDGGETWRSPGVVEVAFPGWVVSDLVWDEVRPGRLWAALWGLWGGGLVAFSDDGGASWTYREGLSDTRVYTLSTVPGRPGRVYAGTLTGVWRSDDTGATWRRVSEHLPEIYKVTSLLVGPEPETVIAGTWQRAYKSEDGGATWRGLYTGMVPDSEVFTLVPVPGAPEVLWASTCGWVYQSTDRGESWQRFQQGFEDRRTPAFAALPSGKLLAGTTDGLHVSDDDGRTWARIGPKGLSVFEIAWHPRRPERVWVATEGSGVWVSEDGGASFERRATGMTNVRVAALLASERRVLAAVNNAGLASGVYGSRDGLRFSAEPSPLPTVLDLAAHGPALYAATERGLWESRGDAWRMVGELGPGRVEQVLSSPERLIVRTAGGFWELAGPRFAPLESRQAPAKSAALAGDELWLGDGESLYRLADGTHYALEAPTATGRIAPAGRGLLLWAEDGLWLRGGGLDRSWVRFASGADRALATGDDRFAALVVSADGAALADAATGRLHPVPLPVRPRDVSAAAVHDGRLLLGTAGYGLWVTELALEAGAGPGGATTAAAP
ncbi:MAG TPA: hypothetical protein VHM02_11180 [Thermoanaerobaculia bacterium]|nr:hypothetical protein [Thermoanaerobaculia bacterium]